MTAVVSVRRGQLVGARYPRVGDPDGHGGDSWLGVQEKCQHTGIIDPSYFLSIRPKIVDTLWHWTWSLGANEDGRAALLVRRISRGQPVDRRMAD